MQIDFFEKPGCINNTKQKQLLEKHGHTIIAHSLLSHIWTPETLRPYFENLPVSKWFNMAAPRIKNGQINLDDFNEQSALEAMLEDPLLIRRPLIKVGNKQVCGFDNETVNMLINNDEVSSMLTCHNLNNVCN